MTKLSIFLLNRKFLLLNVLLYIVIISGLINLFMFNLIPNIEKKQRTREIKLLKGLLKTSKLLTVCSKIDISIKISNLQNEILLNLTMLNDDIKVNKELSKYKNYRFKTIKKIFYNEENLFDTNSNTLRRDVLQKNYDQFEISFILSNYMNKINKLFVLQENNEIVEILL